MGTAFNRVFSPTVPRVGGECHESFREQPTGFLVLTWGVSGSRLVASMPGAKNVHTFVSADEGVGP